MSPLPYAKSRPKSCTSPRSDAPKGATRVALTSDLGSHLGSSRSSEINLARENEEASRPTGGKQSENGIEPTTKLESACITNISGLAEFIESLNETAADPLIGNPRSIHSILPT